MHLVTSLAALLISQSNAFVIPKTATSTCSLAKEQLSSSLRSSVQVDPNPDIPYGEESRKFRRTVYTHDEWVKHRSPNRFYRNLNTLFSSGIYKNVGNEIFATSSVAVSVVLLNALFGGYTDFGGVEHSALIPFGPVSLPLAPFTITSASLGLLLVFRTNTSYQRWDEARKNWGLTINRTRDLVRMATCWYDPKYATENLSASMAAPVPSIPDLNEMTESEKAKREEDLKDLALATWTFARSMKRHLSPPAEDEDAFKAEIREKLPPKRADALINAAHRPNRAMFDLSCAIEKCPMHFLRKNQIHQSITQFEDVQGSNERLLSSPVPLFYARHTARFISVWLLLLPLALYDPFKSTWNHVGMIPAQATIALFLFGIEELATQLEEPFTILPMQTFADRIGMWCNEIVTFTPGDAESL